jgi:hypothetical protein
MRSFVLGAVACLAASASLHAQQSVQSFASLTSFGLSIPTGDTRGFITRPSWMGVTWEGVWAVGQRTSAGVAFGVHDFNHASSGTTNFPWGAATGELLRNLLVTTAMVTGRWYPLAGRTRRPHLGLGAGVLYSEERFELGASRTVRGAAHLAVAPEVGWQFPIVRGVDGVASARYTIPTRRGDYLGGARSNPFATLSFGILERTP